MDRWTDRLSEYLDGELDAREARDLEAHLAACAACAGTLAALREVAARAAAVGPREPARDLWPGIAARLEPRRARLPGLAARLRGLIWPGALAADPTDPYLHDHLASTMRRKMDVLRRVTAAAAYST